MSFDANVVLTIGAKIQELRMARAWSQEKLAEQARISLSTLRSIEAEKNRPRTLTIQKIAQACKVDPVELTSLSWPPSGLNGNIEGEELVQSATGRDEVAKLADQIARLIMMLNRRGAMQAMAGAVVAGTAGQEDALQSIQYGLEGRKVGAEVVEWGRDQVKVLNQLRLRMSGKQLYTIARSNLNLLQTLLLMRATSGKDEQDLRLALAHTASQAGWFAQDVEWLDLATQHYHFAIEMARSVNGEDLAVYGMTRLAAVALADGQPRQCLSRLEAAKAEANEASPLHSFIQMTAVEAQGQLGCCETASRTLAKADVLYDERKDRLPEWLFWLMQPSSTAITARAFITHDPRFAVKLSEDAIAQTSAEFILNRMHLQAGLAKAKLKLGEMDEAVNHAGAVLESVVAAPTPRVEKLLAEFNAQLPDDPVASDFKERFSAYKRTLNA